jgi:hypothetical protein
MALLPRPFFPSILSSLLEERWRALTFAGFAATQVGLVFLGLPALPCPSRFVTNIPCPGCGLSTSLSLMAKGKWQEGFVTHPFAPLFVLAFSLLIAISILPSPLHQKTVSLMTRIETETGALFIVLLAMGIYWGIRMWVKL